MTRHSREQAPRPLAHVFGRDSLEPRQSAESALTVVCLLAAPVGGPTIMMTARRPDRQQIGPARPSRTSVEVNPQSSSRTTGHDGPTPLKVNLQQSVLRQRARGVRPDRPTDHAALASRSTDFGRGCAWPARQRRSGYGHGAHRFVKTRVFAIGCIADARTVTIAETSCPRITCLTGSTLKLAASGFSGH